MLKVNGQNVVQGRFPNNEIDYRKVTISCCNTIRFKLVFESNEDLFNLIIAKKYVDDHNEHSRTELIIAFFPYSQMDRAMDTHMFSLKYVTQLINDLKFDSVTISDPHSNVTPALLNKCHVSYPIFSNTDLDLNNYDLFFYPDSGACKKYSEILTNYKISYRFGEKKRNLDTGEIIKYVAHATEEEVKGKKVLIIDDLVMGGRTFCEAAKALRELGAKQVDLWVTHLMPQSRNFYRSKGDGLLDHIYTADTLGLIPYFEQPNPRP